MKDKFFIDTNIFVYSFNQKDTDKKRKSQEIIKKALETRQGCISTQVIQEFVNVATRKFKTPMKISDLNLYLHEVLFPLCTAFVNFDIIEKALKIHDKYKFSYYDSTIISAALFTSSKILISEDFNENQKIENLTILNPFTV
ncbi:MAG: PIN domain-containing protein [Spirochaetia bacterium]|nr:PIN domain-containing protein [Spirochaetia bacterium]